VLIRTDSESKKIKRRFSFSKVSFTEKIIMIRNLGVMFSTGLPLVKSFGILSAQTKNKKLKNALLDIKERISKGENLSSAMSAHGDIFSNFFQNMVKVGEESGTLEEVFQILSLQLGKEHELKSKINNAMIYPAVVLATMLIVAVIVIVFVMPDLKSFFTDLNVDIPIYTKIFFDVGDFISTKWYVVALIFLLLIIIAGLSLRTKKGKWLLDTFLIRMPFISQIIKKDNAAFLIRSLSSLLISGVSIVRSLEITSETVGNYYFRKAVIEASKKVTKGEKLSNSLRYHQDIFPIGVMEMIEVGEETGKTSDILKKLADFYEKEAIDAVEKVSIVIEPALIILLGLAVGFFAFSVIVPIYSSLNSIQ
ncbi:MAG: type II secretion system F family protein, partial [Candidatus Staskawiczbacteria bacterium]|nr:type II secretion system F family protein [Candidatus Staskawiczbacteria bacterium]